MMPSSSVPKKHKRNISYLFSSSLIHYQKKNARIGQVGNWALTSRRDLEALILDKLLDTVGDVEIVLLVLEADVARLEVAVLGDGVPRRIRLLPVTFEHVGPFEPQLAWLARPELRAFGRDVLGGHVGEHLANGADGRVPFFPGLKGWIDCIGQHEWLGKVRR